MQFNLTSALSRRNGVYHGWWIVFAGFVNQAVAAALIQRSFGSYVVLLKEDFGWSKAAISGAYSLQQVENGMLGPAQGWLIDRFGPRASMRVGIVVFGLGFIAFSMMQDLRMFYISYLMLALGSNFAGYFPFSVVIVNWFSKKRARALSTMQMGGATGGLLVVLIVVALESFGWRATAFASGIIVMAVGLPVTFIVGRRPEDYGLHVDGAEVPAETVHAVGSMAVADGPEEPNFTLRQAMAEPSFWLISLGHGSAVLIVAAVNVHLVLHLTEDMGYSLTLASFIVTLLTMFQIVGMVIGAAIGDRYDKRLVSMLCMALHAFALVLVANAVNGLMVYAFAILHGTAWGLRGPMMAAIRADYFGRSSYGAILGTSSMIVMLGSISGPLVAGILADQTGSYSMGFTILAVLSGLGSVFFLIAKKPQAPKSAPPAMAPVLEESRRA